MHLIGLILLSIAVIAITVVLFVGWVAYSIGRAIWMTLTAGSRKRVTSRAIGDQPKMGQVRCLRTNCRNLNPATARFCRRCGGKLMASGAVRERMIA